jgi:hypothetical protein
MDVTLWMRRFTIRVRMFGAIGVVLGLLAVVGGLALAGMFQIQASSERFIDSAFAASVKLSQMREAVSDIRRAEQELLKRFETMDSTEDAFARWQTAWWLVVASSPPTGRSKGSPAIARLLPCCANGCAPVRSVPADCPTQCVLPPTHWPTA